MLKGRLVGLTAVEKADLEPLMNWRNKPEFRRYFREYRELNMAMQEQWFEKLLNEHNCIMFSIRMLDGGELIGCCGYVYINWIHRHADLSLYIGWNDSYIDELGYAEDACRVLLDYGFRELSLNKVWTEIYEFDENKLKLYNKFNFSRDGCLRQNYYYNGRWWNSNILSILSSEHDWGGR
jgi:RimJ/RimL family protein N-acetyltransferase